MAISGISITLLAIISCISAESNCRMLIGDEKVRGVYSCIQATLDDIDNIPDDAEWIRFTVSKLPHLPERAFARFALRGLSFYNCEIGRINPNAFDGLDKLERFTLYGSNIHVLKASWFKEMSSLIHLFLDRNDMVYIEPDVFPLLSNIEQLNIEDNNLNCLSNQALEPLKKLKYARIGKNPWLCSCYAKLIGWMKNQQIDYGLRNTTKERLECMMEHVPQNRDFMVPPYKIFNNVSLSDTGLVGMNMARDVLFIGKDISALSEIPNNVRSIKFVNSEILEIPRLSFLRFGNSLTSLYFRNCSIREIHPDAFAGLPKLELLFLFDNNFSTVRSEWFRDLHSLENLALDENGIDYIEPSVFPLLDKLKHWSLGRNKIQCISNIEFNSLKHLKEVILAHNPWNCSCQENLRKWLHENRVRYVISRGQCINGQIQDSEDLFEQSFERRETKIKTQNAGLNHEEITRKHGHQTQTGRELYDDISANIQISETQRDEITEAEIDHKRNVEIANLYEYYHIRAEQQRQYDAKVTQLNAQNYTDSKTGKDMNSSPSNDHENKLNDVTKDSIPENLFIKPSSFDMQNSHVSVGGTIWDMLSISTNATAIRFENSAIPEIINIVFFPYGDTLRRLEFSNCMVRDIEPQAFKELTNLHELILNDNHIKVVKSAWFEGLSNLRTLSLARNFITRIDNGVFRLLPNLEQLHISNNKLNCLGVDGLSHLKNLYTIDIDNNPWSCICQKKLNEWLDEHNDSIKDFFDDIDDRDCSTESTSFRLTNNQETNSIDSENSDAEQEIEETSKIVDIEMNHGLRKRRETVSTTTENSNIPETGDTEEIIGTPTTKKPRSSDAGCSLNEFYRTKGSWWCSGDDISVLDKIPSSAVIIDIAESSIPVIPDNAFVRFQNLTKLIFYKSNIRAVEPWAFATLNKLEWLIFLDTSIPTVIRSSWFRDLTNVTTLGLVGNKITEIESDVFEHLPNLKELSVQKNNLKCIYTKSLSSLKYLQKITIQNNPWKWRCREELTQFFEARNISYIRSETYEGNRVIADLY